MGDEHLLALREFQSLVEMSHEIEKKVQQQKLRVTNIEAKKTEKIEEEQKLTSDITLLKKQIELTEQFLKKSHQEIEKMKQHLWEMGNSEASKSYEQQKKLLEKKVEQEEELGLSYYESMEAKEKELISAKEFLKNIDSTIDEIKNEVSLVAKDFESELNQKKAREAELLNHELKSLKHMVMHALTIHPVKFTTTLSRNCCSNCGMEVASSLYQQMLKEHQVRPCSICQKLLIP